jgi:HEAT repeat protein
MSARSQLFQGNMRALFFSFFAWAATVLATASIAQTPLPTITFDNQSGKPALVGLIGPKSQTVDVPQGQKRTVTAVAGLYYVVSRYGASVGNYTYAKGDPFTVVQSATKRSVITITLHPVPNGNYGTRSISADEFEKAASLKASAAPAPVLGTDSVALWARRLNDPDPNNRRDAIEGLSNIKDPRVVEPLTAALRGDPDAGVRKYTASVLGEVKAPWAAEVLIAGLTDADAGVRKAAASALGDIALAKITDPGAIEPLIASLKDPDAGVRSNALYALGFFKDPRAVQPAIAATQDPDVNVRAAAVTALYYINDPSALDTFIAALKDQDSRVRGAAIGALGRTKDPRAIEPLISVLNDIPNQQSVWQELAGIGMPAVDPLLAVLKSGSYGARTKAALALIKIGKPGTESDLIEALNTTNDLEIAQAALNSGNFSLEAAARTWASKHNVPITDQTTQFPMYPAWGSAGHATLR